MRRPRFDTVLALLSMLLGACAPATQAPASAPDPAASPQGSSSPTTSAPATPPTPSTATDVLTQGRAPFDACYATARKARPDLRRTSVEITWTMDDAGKLLNVDFAYKNRMDDAAKDCMRAAAEALQFPPSLHGKQTAAIVFTPP